MSESQGPEHEFERLSKAITDAVMNSENVKKIVAEIQKKDKICPQSFMVLVLKMEVLTESLDMEIEEEFVEKKSAKKRSKKKPSRQPQYIDGRKLSKHEVEFEKIASEKFDTQLWLKRNGLIF